MLGILSALCGTGVGPQTAAEVLARGPRKSDAVFFATKGLARARATCTKVARAATAFAARELRGLGAFSEVAEARREDAEAGDEDWVTALHQSRKALALMWTGLEYGERLGATSRAWAIEVLSAHNDATVAVGGRIGGRGGGGVDYASFYVTSFERTYASVGLVKLAAAPWPAPHPAYISSRRLASSLPGVAWNSFSGQWLLRGRADDAPRERFFRAPDAPVRMDWGHPYRAGNQTAARLGEVLVALAVDAKRGTLRFGCSDDDYDFRWADDVLDVSSLFRDDDPVAFAVSLYPGVRAQIQLGDRNPDVDEWRNVMPDRIFDVPEATLPPLAPSSRPPVLHFGYA